MDPFCNMDTNLCVQCSFNPLEARKCLQTEGRWDMQNGHIENI